MFREIQSAVAPTLAKSSEEEVCSAITTQTLQSVCVGCPAHGVCVGVGKVKDADIYKTVAIGLAKGRVSVLDLSGETAKTCAYQNNLLFCINNLLARYRQMEESKENAEVGKKLLAEEVGGVAEVLEKLSASYATPCLYDSKVERAVYVALAERGVFPSEIMAQKGGALSVLLAVEEGTRAHKFAPVLSRAVGAPLTLAERVAVTPQKCVAVYRPRPRYGVATGLAIQKKAGSPRSGDTHSLLKVGADQILFAVSDGMGSGENAGEISASAIGLIESFYRAGFSSKATLTAVNRLLSARAEENFAALDIATLSLSNGRCTFFKIGAPYGFVIKREGVLVVEGNSLPLGILDDISPQAYESALAPGDTVILVSDGISDAFRSASDFLDFLSAEKGLNPQNLADSILARAKELTGGECRDDMTVLCVRLFENGGV
ncbi:MAG: SpoIIE family protein phosphatase [Clostridia bacterium]|nr:SpoIIE family protein phosphatase [Clostridia bacterium]